VRERVYVGPTDVAHPIVIQKVICVLGLMIQHITVSDFLCDFSCVQLLVTIGSRKFSREVYIQVKYC